MKTQFIGDNPSIQKIKDNILSIKDKDDMSIIISGETGVGKEVLARKIHELSNRGDKPFIKVNCGAVPENLLESELYGYVQGAFTDAKKRKRGKFELAHKGVLFLDEIGDMSMNLQIKLLHALEEGKFVPVGSEKEIKTDVRVIAATNCDLEEKVRNKEFRSDLYYRLDGFIFHLPPLRERIDDIPALIEYHTKCIAEKNGLNGINPLNQEIIDNLMAYRWPGNVRQLISILKRILVLGKGEEISGKLLNGNELSWSINKAGGRPNQQNKTVVHDIDSPDFSLKKVCKEAVTKVEYETILKVLRKTDGNKTKAAAILKVSYKTLLTKINELGIHHDD